MENKYLGSTGLAKFLENLYNVFSPVGHSHTKSQITDFPTIPTDVSQLNNDSGYITAEDIPNLEISVDSMLSENSENPVQNKVIKYEIDNLTAQIEDASSKYLTVDMLNEDEAEPNTINADTLGGYAASEYIRKDQASVEVNYSVVGSPAAPATPTQNMIWIETSTPIGRVFFGNNEPNETFIDGDVWICTGDRSKVAFNALKIGSNYVNMIYPFYATQMQDGTLVDVPAKSWQDGEWVDWTTYLYIKGDQCEDLSGGWASTKYDSGYSSTSSVSFDTDRIAITSPTASNSCIVHTKNKINLSDVSEIVVKVDIGVTYQCCRLIIDDATTGNSPIASVSIGHNETSLDVSSHSGSYYIGVVCENDAYNANYSSVYITEVRIVK